MCINFQYPCTCNKLLGDFLAFPNVIIALCGIFYLHGGEIDLDFWVEVLSFSNLHCKLKVHFVSILCDKKKG